MQRDGMPAEKSGTGISMIESMKKATSELLVLSFLKEKSMPITEIVSEIAEKSSGLYTISGAYALFYRLERFGYLHEAGRKIAKDNRRRQFYEITPEGRAYCQLLYRQYFELTAAIENILQEGGGQKEG